MMVSSEGVYTFFTRSLSKMMMNKCTRELVLCISSAVFSVNVSNWKMLMIKCIRARAMRLQFCISRKYHELQNVDEQVSQTSPMQIISSSQRYPRPINMTGLLPTPISLSNQKRQLKRLLFIQSRITISCIIETQILLL